MLIEGVAKTLKTWISLHSNINSSHLDVPVTLWPRNLRQSRGGNIKTKILNSLAKQS